MKFNSMSPKTRKFTLVTAWLLLLACTGELWADVTTQQVNASQLERTAQWRYQLEGLGGLWLGYYDTERALHLRDPKGGDRILVQPEKDRAPSGLALAGLPEGVNALWRQKFPNKSLYLANSNFLESTPLVTGEGTEPLTRLKGVNLDGTLHLLWYGEAGDPLLDQQYFVFYQNINPFNGEKSPIERVTPGIYPVWAYDKKGNIIVFSWIQDTKGSRIIAKTRRPGGGDFGPAVVVAEVPTISHYFQAFRSGERWFAVWETRYEKNRLEGAYSDDLGQTWKRFGFDDLGDFLLGSLVVDADDEGRIYIALSGSDLAKPGQKQDVRFISSTDRGETWKLHRPRPQAIGEKFRGRNPSVVIGPSPGQVLLVWEDWRNLRGQLYASLSYDGAQTWVYDNIPLPQPPGVNRGLTDEFSSAYFHDRSYHVITQQPTDDGYTALNLYVVIFDPTDLKQIAVSLQQPNPPLTETKVLENAPIETTTETTPSPSIPQASESIQASVEDNLKKRVEGFWNTMISKDYIGAYGFQDPFYRAKIRPDTYSQQMGRIKYTEAKVEAIRIEGPIATVKTQVNASVPPFRAGTGETISRPEKEINITETWLWIDGDWYREFYSEYLDKKFTIH